MWNVWTINDLKCTPFRHLHCLSILYSYTCINNWYLYHPFEYIDQIHVFSESRTRRHNTSQPETDIKKGFQRMKHEIEKIYTECNDFQLVDDGFKRTYVNLTNNLSVYYMDTVREIIKKAWNRKNINRMWWLSYTNKVK